MVGAIDNLLGVDSFSVVMDFKKKTVNTCLFVFFSIGPFTNYFVPKVNGKYGM
jgi:hypothetical protein